MSDKWENPSVPHSGWASLFDEFLVDI